MERWIKCRKCGHEYSSKLSKCPACSCITWNLNLIISLIIVALIIVVVAVAMVTGFGDKSNPKTENSKVLSTISIPSKEDIVTSSEEVKETATNSKKTETSSKTTTTASKKTETVSSKGNTSSKLNQSQAVSSSNAYNFKVGTELVGDDYYITLPLEFLQAVYKAFGIQEQGIKFDDFAYTLSDDDKTAGFNMIIKNIDGSATKIISESKYNRFLPDYIIEVNKFVKNLEQLDYVTEIKSTNNFKSFGVVLNKNKKDLTDSQYAQIMLLGITGAEQQYYTINSDNQCSVTLKYADGEEEKLIFPQDLFD